MSRCQSCEWRQDECNIDSDGDLCCPNCTHRREEVEPPPLADWERRLVIGPARFFVCREPFPHDGPCEQSHFVHGDPS